MPRYPYKCEKCGAEETVYTSVQAYQPERECSALEPIKAVELTEKIELNYAVEMPFCRGTMKRVYHPFGIQMGGRIR